MADDINTPNDELAYDLRQRYAKEVADNMEAINLYRKERNWSAYFDAIEDLYIVTYFKWKKEDPETNYITYRNKISLLSNEYHSIWLGQADSPEAVGLIKAALKDLEMHVYFKMNEANMFGSKYADDDDEL